jgi:hypothetical protein
VQRLSRSGHSAEGEGGGKQGGSAASQDGGTVTAAAAAAALPARRNDTSAVNAARDRYLQRKQGEGAGRGGAGSRK